MYFSLSPFFPDMSSLNLTCQEGLCRDPGQQLMAVECLGRVGWEPATSLLVLSVQPPSPAIPTGFIAECLSPWSTTVIWHWCLSHLIILFKGAFEFLFPNLDFFPLPPFSLYTFWLNSFPWNCINLLFISCHLACCDLSFIVNIFFLSSISVPCLWVHSVPSFSSALFFFSVFLLSSINFYLFFFHSFIMFLFLVAVHHLYICFCLSHAPTTRLLSAWLWLPQPLVSPPHTLPFLLRAI